MPGNNPPAVGFGTHVPPGHRPSADMRRKVSSNNKQKPAPQIQAPRPSMPGAIDNSMLISAVGGIATSTEPKTGNRKEIDLTDDPPQSSRSKPPQVLSLASAREFKEARGSSEGQSPVPIGTPAEMSSWSRVEAELASQAPPSRPASAQSGVSRISKVSNASSRMSSTTAGKVLKYQIEPEEVITDQDHLELVRRYISGGTTADGLSLESQVVTFLEMAVSDDLIVSGQGDHGHTRYALEKDFLYRVKSLCENFQHWIDEAYSSLDEELQRRRICYTIDPNGAITSTLTVSTSKFDIKVLWRELQGRVVRARQWAKKFVADVCQESMPTPTISSIEWNEMAYKSHVPGHVARAHVLHSNALGLLEDEDQRERIAKGADLAVELPPGHPYWERPLEPDNLKYNERRSAETRTGETPAIARSQDRANVDFRERGDRTRRVDFIPYDSPESSAQEVQTILTHDPQVERRRPRPSAMQDDFARIGRGGPPIASRGGMSEANPFSQFRNQVSARDVQSWRTSGIEPPETTASISQALRTRREDRDTPPHLTRHPGGGPPSEDPSSDGDGSGGLSKDSTR